MAKIKVVGATDPDVIDVKSANVHIIEDLKPGIYKVSYKGQIRKVKVTEDKTAKVTFKEPIEKARQTYEERVSGDVAENYDYFSKALDELIARNRAGLEKEGAE